jgi:hypothetical protein
MGKPSMERNKKRKDPMDEIEINAEPKLGPVHEDSWCYAPTRNQSPGVVLPGDNEKEQGEKVSCERRTSTKKK